MYCQLHIPRPVSHCTPSSSMTMHNNWGFTTSYCQFWELQLCIRMSLRLCSGMQTINTGSLAWATASALGYYYMVSHYTQIPLSRADVMLYHIAALKQSVNMYAADSQAACSGTLASCPVSHAWILLFFCTAVCLNTTPDTTINSCLRSWLSKSAMGSQVQHEACKQTSLPPCTHTASS